MDKQEVIISGIQQIGIGVSDVEAAWKWYKEYFGCDVLVFDEWADAEFMLPYTGGEPRSRHACLVLNLQGGGGFEVWQHTGFEPRKAAFDILPGDLGIYACKIKCKNAEAYYAKLKKKEQKVSEKIYTDATGRKYFFLTDPFGNLFQMIEPTKQQAGWLFSEGLPTGGVYGAIVGTHDMEAALKFYNTMLGYDTVLADETKPFDDFASQGCPGVTFRRVVLAHSEPRKGPFSKVLGPSEIELIQAIDRPTAPRKIFEDRMWGELGFIQICYDIRNMNGLREKCKENNCPFTVDSMAYKANFNMGDAGGDFAYNEDPSGTLIEYVQTNNVTLVNKKALGGKIHVSMKAGGFDDDKELPRWMTWCLRFLRK